LGGDNGKVSTFEWFMFFDIVGQWVLVVLDMRVCHNPQGQYSLVMSEICGEFDEVSIIFA